MKALSVVEPWGTMIANGTKSLEIRSWSPELLPILNVALVQNNTRLTRGDDEDVDGRVVAVVDIVSCEPWKKEDCKHSGCDESEFEEGWLAWKLRNIRKLNNPVNAIAKRKFYDLTDVEAIAVKRELET
ncbi:ASCH domain-containing protein [Vibrio parahaemolyticus]|nr:ASCH domain-containing protein [Vibrio parahaemolyticus]